MQGHVAKPQVTSLDAARYEVSHTEDVLQVAFHTPEDAVGWCLKAQISLLNAAWPPELEDISWPASLPSPIGMALCTLSTYNTEAALMACCIQMDHVIASASFDSTQPVDMQQANKLLTWGCMQAQCLEQAHQNVWLDWACNLQQRFVIHSAIIHREGVLQRPFMQEAVRCCWS